MSENKTSDLLQQLSLGKQSDYKSNYDADLLDTVPRSLTREALGLSSQTQLPFVGTDIWTGYEVSWLNSKGKPQVAIAEFHFNHDSENLIESKSFKLYLNSFNQMRYETQDRIISIIEHDLSSCSGAPVNVTFYSLSDYAKKGLVETPGISIDQLDIEINDFDYNPLLLKKAPNNALTNVTEILASDLLKSNCLVTGQPDWASVIIQYSGTPICHESLLKYLVSFRGHNEFHEHCVERIFCDLIRHFELANLTVYARYTRRGGLDINPIRSTHAVNFDWLRLARQ